MRGWLSVRRWAGLLLLLRPLAGSGQAIEEPPRVEYGVLAFALQPDFAEQEGLKARSLGVRLGGSFPVYRAFAIGADVAALALPGRYQPPADSAASRPTDRVSGWSASLSAGVATPELRLWRQTLISIGLGMGYAWMRGARTPVVSAFRLNPQHPPVESRKLDIHGGGFVEPNLRLHVSGVDAIVRYRAYRSSADLEQALLVGVSVRIRRPAG